MGVFNPGIQGTLTSTRVPYATGTKLLADSGLTWDNTNSRLGVNRTTPSAPLEVRGTPVDIGYIATFRPSINESCFLQIVSTLPTNGAAGFAFANQGIDSNEWRLFMLGSQSNSLRYGWNSTGVMWYHSSLNVSISADRKSPTTGTYGLLFQNGTALSGIPSDSAGLYANDVDSSSELFAINELGDKIQLTGSRKVITTTGNIDDLAFGGAKVIIMNNASDSTIRGLAAGYDGQVVRILSKGAGNVFLAHQDTNSSAANRLVNWVTSGLTPLSTARGSASYVYDATGQRWRLVDHTQGTAITTTFAAGDFTANGSMTWTVASGDVTVDSYMIVGRTMLYNFRFLTTTVGGTLNTILIRAMPAGYTLAEAFDGIFYAEDNGTKATGWMFNNSNTGIGFAKLAGGNWAAATDNTRVSGYVIMSLT